MSDGRLSMQQVLARFDQAIGLETSPRTSAGTGAVPEAPSAADRVPVPAVVAPARAPAASAAAAPAFRTSAPTAAPIASTHVYPPESLRAPGDAADRARRLSEIDARHAASCPHCLAATGHTRLVFGEGAAHAELMFVGEAPGDAEDRIGRPFLGAAGEKLDEMIKAMGLSREQVYIASILKSRTPDDRTPMPEEVAACGPFLMEQILAVQPKVIVTLGGPAAKWICGTDAGISRIRGTWQQWTPPAGADCPPIPVMPTYHPSYVLRTYTKQVRMEVWSDLRAVLAKLGRTPPVPGGTNG
jgi:DNA polymerase